MTLLSWPVAMKGPRVRHSTQPVHHWANAVGACSVGGGDCKNRWPLGLLELSSPSVEAVFDGDEGGACREFIEQVMRVG
ncbi:hypothetical protein [Roseinatronobacter bogoriensis]|uniref:hypothetical protein n=1 Tax=Roseinatronobacter bogoriensis TaxID=119542 RepID=UPI0014562AD7|nr:hypothetical protein [Rhodobaca bogoriensis]